MFDYKFFWFDTGIGHKIKIYSCNFSGFPKLVNQIQRENLYEQSGFCSCNAMATLRTQFIVLLKRIDFSKSTG